MTRQQFIKTAPLVLFVGITLCSAQSGLAQTAPHAVAAPTAVKTWQPVPAALPLLSAPVALSAYTMRLPNRWSAVTLPPGMHPPAGVSYFGFAGLLHPDSAKPSITVVIAKLPASSPSKPLDQVMQDMVGGKKRQWTSFEQTQPETGRVGAITFERCGIRGLANTPAGPRMVQGIVYTALDHGSVIAIGAEDAASDAPKTLPLAEAAILTFARRPTAAP